MKIMTDNKNNTRDKTKNTESFKDPYDELIEEEKRSLESEENESHLSKVKGKEELDSGDVEFMSPVTASYYKQPNKRSKTLLYSIFLFFAVILIWANFAEIDEVTSGEGKVVPSGQVKTINHLEGGI